MGDIRPCLGMLGNMGEHIGRGEEGMEGTSTWGRGAWPGVCPPPGHPPHAQLGQRFDKGRGLDSSRHLRFWPRPSRIPSRGVGPSWGHAACHHNELLLLCASVHLGVSLGAELSGSRGARPRSCPGPNAGSWAFPQLVLGCVLCGSFGEDPKSCLHLPSPRYQAFQEGKEQRMPWPAVCPLFLLGPTTCPMARRCSLTSWKQMDSGRVWTAGSLAWSPE